MYERANINQIFLPLSNPLSLALCSLPVYSKVPQVTETFHHPITPTNLAVISPISFAPLYVPQLDGRQNL